MPILEQVLEHNPDTVKIVFKNMPLNFHKFAAPAALAALAAGNQGKFWEFHDELFSQTKLSKEAIDAIAVKLSLDMEMFKKDVNSPEIRKKLQKDLQDAQKAGVTGTPTIFVNGVKLKSRTVPAIQKLVDAQLSDR